MKNSYVTVWRSEVIARLNPRAKDNATKRLAWITSWVLCSVLFFEGAFAQAELEPEQTILNEAQLYNQGSQEDDQTDEPTAEEIAAERARLQEISRQESLRQAAVQEMQSELGIYDPALQEAYSDFGAFYSQIEDYESAVELHSNALQVARINTGLYSAEQLPIIDALIRNNRLLGDWQEVDNLQELDYFVASRIYSPEDPEFISAVEDYGNWNLKVVRENILDLSSRGLLDRATELSMFYARALAKMDVQSSTELVAYLGIIRAKTQTDLTLARSIAGTPFTAFAGTTSQFVTQNRCRNGRNAQGQVVRQCVNVQVENPRYRQSQRDAKNLALRRYTRQIEDSIELLRQIRHTSDSLSESEKLGLDSQIAELETESVQLTRVGRRLSVF